MKEIIEKIEDGKYSQFVVEQSEENGCDCWGVTDWIHRKFVYVGDEREKQQVFDGWYIAHDGENVIEVLSEDGLKWRKEREESAKRAKEHLEKTGFETPREYAAFLKGKGKKEPTAYEFHNMDTGHCYVDYISHPEMGEAEGYTRKPLYE
jgi:hypothetical protein